jgi:hypothetical protein
MRWEYTLLSFIFGITVVLFLGFYFFNVLMPFLISPIHFFGFLVLVIIAFALIFVEVMRAKSPPFMSNAIYAPFNEKEIRVIPWNNELVQENGEPMDIAFVPLGGINFMGFNPESPNDQPIAICPAYDLKRNGEGLATDTNLKPKDLDEIPADLRHYGVKTFGRRLTKSPKILYGLTSHTDGSANAHNERIMFEQTKENRQIAKLEDLLDKAYQQLERRDRTKEKTYFINRVGEGKEESWICLMNRKH